MSVETYRILRSLGFTADPTVISDPPGGLSYSFPEFKLSASVCIGHGFGPVILFSGVYATERTIAEIAFELPRRVESLEQGVAWLVAGLYGRPRLRFDPGPAADWLTYGGLHKHTLPWERRRAAYEARPACSVEKDWMRLALRKLALLLDAADDDTKVSFRFDGEALGSVAAMNPLSLVQPAGLGRKSTPSGPSRCEDCRSALPPVP